MIEYSKDLFNLMYRYLYNEMIEKVDSRIKIIIPSNKNLKFSKDENIFINEFYKFKVNEILNFYNNIYCTKSDEKIKEINPYLTILFLDLPRDIDGLYNRDKKYIIFLNLKNLKNGIKRLRTLEKKGEGCKFYRSGWMLQQSYFLSHALYYYIQNKIGKFERYKELINNENSRYYTENNLLEQEVENFTSLYLMYTEYNLKSLYSYCILLKLLKSI